MSIYSPTKWLVIPQNKSLIFFLDKPYFISLQTAGTYSKPYHVQVNLEGDEGTVKFHLSYRYLWWWLPSWGTIAVSDKDIGELQWVYLMVIIPNSFILHQTLLLFLYVFSTSSRSFFSQFVSIIIVHLTSDLNDADILHMNNQKITKVNITST